MTLLFAALGCDVELSGSVTEPTGEGIAGATLDAPGCAAVTDSAGAFRARCTRGKYSFTVHHPTHADGALAIDATGTMGPAPGKTSLLPWPTAVGWYRAYDFAPLPATPLKRTITDDEQRFCVEAPSRGPAVADVFEVHGYDWRALALDDAGCAYQLSKSSGGNYWSPAEQRVAETSREHLATGRDRVVLAVAGPTVIVPWYDGFLVPADVNADTWLAWTVE